MTNLEAEDKIIPAYDGVLSNKMHWQIDTLRELSKAADLREQIIIKNEATQSKTPTNLGEVLAWRRFADINQLLFKRDHSADVLKVRWSHKYNTSIVAVDDQQLVNQITKDGTRRFDEALYIERFNKLVRQGIMYSIVGEKSVQSAFNNFLTAMILGPSVIGSDTFRNGIIHHLEGRYLESGVEFIGGIAGIGIATFFSAYVINFDKVTTLIDDPHFTKRGDLNPTKPFIDFVKGWRYLQKSAKEIVTYRP